MNHSDDNVVAGQHLREMLKRGGGTDNKTATGDMNVRNSGQALHLTPRRWLRRKGLYVAGNAMLIKASFHRALSCLRWPAGRADGNGSRKLPSHGAAIFAAANEGPCPVQGAPASVEEEGKIIASEEQLAQSLKLHQRGVLRGELCARQQGSAAHEDERVLAHQRRRDRPAAAHLRGVTHHPAWYMRQQSHPAPHTTL
eukprot:848296-Pleurochrysis_carterae.AAC.3